MQNYPSTIRFHTIIMNDIIWCGTHSNATKSKSHYECDHNIYHKGCTNPLAVGLAFNATTNYGCLHIYQTIVWTCFHYQIHIFDIITCVEGSKNVMLI